MEKSDTEPKIDLRYLIKGLLKYNASDLHLKAGRPPLYRINGKLIPAKLGELSKDVIDQLVLGFLSPVQKEALERLKQIDLSFQVADLGRFRASVYFQKGTLSAAIRMIPLSAPQLTELGIPVAPIQELCQHKSGLVIVTGSTGSGKSTTLAAIVQYINQNNYFHILTLEDPIEFVHRDHKSSITQREVGSDMPSIQEGLLAGLRQDPDVIIIGEMRDLTTIQVALTAAETGHLVFGTLHTNDATSTITRILDVFPAESKNQVRAQLASSLAGILAQRLLERADGTGLIPACEVLIKSPAIESYILSGELERIPEAMASSNTYYKMQTMNQSLQKLVEEGVVTTEEALKSSPSPDDLKLKLSGLDRSEGYHSQ